MATALDVPNVRMRSSNDAEEVTVTWEDQQRINEFGRVYQNYGEVRNELEVKLQKVGDTNDAYNTLMAAFDAEDVKILVGEVFVTFDVDSGMEKLTEMKEKLEAECEVLRSKKGEFKKRLTELRSTLYSKLGDSVNLDFSDDES